MFSDFDVQMRQPEGGPPVTITKKGAAGYRVDVDQAVHGTINGGGQEIQLRTYSGRIYIRKAGAR